MLAIEVKNLAKRVRDADGWLNILDDVSFTLEKGHSLAIVGASGSGKSTLLGLMAGLDTPSSGQVLALGRDLFTLDEDERAAWRAGHLGFVFQSFQLLAQMTALENVMLPAELAGKSNATQLAKGWLEKVGLGDRLNHYPRTLSGGEQQRVAIARAFCAQPALLFADEPTGSLDTQTARRVIDLLFELKERAGTTLILVTHDPALAERCERQILIQAGKLVG